MNAALDPTRDPVVVVCGCGKRWRLSEWRVQPLRGDQVTDGLPLLELRDCVCQSTRGVFIDAERNPVNEDGSPLVEAPL